MYVVLMSIPNLIARWHWKVASVAVFIITVYGIVSRLAGLCRKVATGQTSVCVAMSRSVT
jgi:hypothetical protein